MARGWVHTTHKGGRWVNEVEGNQRASSSHETKAEAEQRGREIARNRKTEHVIHKKDGTIGERNSYGNDPRNVPG